MNRFFTASALMATLLGACSTTAKFPAASVARFADGSEWVMTGELFGNMDGSSRTILSGSGITCETNLTRRADKSSVGTQICTDSSGVTVLNEPVTVPAGAVKMGFNGRYTSEFDFSDVMINGKSAGIGVVAFGWGRFADVETLRALLP